MPKTKYKPFLTFNCQHALEFYEIQEEDLKVMKKGDWRKASIAMVIKNRTVLNGTWIAQALHMGQRSGVTKAIRAITQKLERNEIKKKSVFTD